MERWIGKVAVVTGASSGIGAAIVVHLANVGVNVVGLARRKELIEELQSKIIDSKAGKLYAYKCDVSNENDVLEAFKWIKDNIGGVDILVSNAGIVKLGVRLVDKNNSDVIRSVLNTNVLGSAYCVRESFQLMSDRNFPGHIILINSVVGHNVIYSPHAGLNMYPPSKYALTAMTEILRQEFQGLKSQVKITSISPGAVLTNIFSEEVKKSLTKNNKILNPEDIASAVQYVLSTPPHVQVHELIIKPIGEAM